jgi:hypothetical protein
LTQTRVDPSQHKNKSNYYHNFKTQFEGWPKPGLAQVNVRIKVIIIIVLKLDSGSAWTWVDLSQRKNKSDYYHSFKTQFRGWPGARPESRVWLTINPN